MRYFFLLVLICLQSRVNAQELKPLVVEFDLKWLETELTLPFTIEDTQIDIFRCYVTHFELWDDNQLVWKEDQSFHLLDGEVGESMILQLEVPEGLEYDNLKFNLGIDSTTNVSGAFGGDLDPTKGMFWAWNTGYINFKLEGSNPMCKTRKNKFQFHLGGYAAPYPTIQEVVLPIKNQRGSLKIPIRLDRFLQDVDLSSQHTIMTPGVESFELAKIAQQIFTIIDEK